MPQVAEISKEILLSLSQTPQAESIERVMKVMRQAKQGERLRFYLQMHFRRLKKNVSSGLCRPDLGVLFRWPIWGSAGVITRVSLSSGLWLGKAQELINTHPIFFPANLLHETGMYFPLCISQQTKTVVSAEETMKNSIWQFQQSSARKKEIQ